MIFSVNDVETETETENRHAVNDFFCYSHLVLSSSESSNSISCGSVPFKWGRSTPCSRVMRSNYIYCELCHTNITKI